MNGPARTHSGRASRPPGREFQALAWTARHPGFVAVPLIVLGLALVLGPILAAILLGALVGSVAVWGRAHPASFDRFAAPALRATWRRWTVYRGRRWAQLMSDTGLTKEHRHTGDQLVPRVLRVRSSSASIDTVYVRMVRGQDVAYWQERSSILWEALIAHRVAITRHRPGVVAIVIEWELPFTRTIPAPDIPEQVDDVDLGAVEIGDNERGEPFTAPVIGGHRLVAGASGSGKGSVLWSTLRGVGPCIRDGIVRVWMVDLKGGVETEQGAPLFHRYATSMPQALELLTEFRDAMRDRQDDMRDQNIRACTPSVGTPVELLVIDEMAMLTAYGDRTSVRDALRLLAEVMTQGRASLFAVHGYLQEPSKDVVDVRELFTQRICLGVTAASHVDMVLGEGARERGALADEIPGDARHAGIGFVIDKGSRLPIRFRAAFVSDNDITERHHAMADVRPSHLRAWVKETSTVLAPSTVHLVFGYLRSLFGAAVSDRVIATSPCSGVRLPEIDKRDYFIPGPEKVHALAALIAERYRAVPYVAAGCGLRGGAIFGLELDDVDLDAGEIRVVRQMKRMVGAPAYLGELKSRSSRRTVELPDIVADALRDHIATYPPATVEIEDRTDPRNVIVRPARLLFVTGNGLPLHRSNWSTVWRSAVRRARLPQGFGLHGLRHYFATLLIHNGASVKTVQLALGHSSPMITLNTYAHEWPDALDRTRTLVDTALGAGLR